MMRVPLTDVKNELSRYLRLAETEEVIITRHGRPAGLLIGFADEEAWFEYRLQHDPRFQRRIAEARESLQFGRGIRIEDLPADGEGGAGDLR